MSFLANEILKFRLYWLIVTTF